MHPKLNRRHFLSATAAATACTLLPAFPSRGAQFRGKIRKAKIVGQVTEAALKPLKEAGFDGVETTHICPEEEAARGRVIAEKLGFGCHSVLRGWMEFNSPDPASVEASLEETKKALRAAKAYGADDILLVPC